MSVLEILKYPHPLLSKKSKTARKVDQRIKRLIDDMIDTMRAAPGVGLAAPQVGELVRVIVVDIGEGVFGLVNPKITKKGKAKQTFDEGCLCLPGLVAPVERNAEITVKGLDRNGASITIDAAGFLSTVLQHEIDHLEGIVFIKKVKDPSLIREVSRKEEEDKKEFL